MERLFLATGSLFALIGVITRALSSHAIHDFLSGRGKLDNFNLASDYLVLHGLALIAVAILVHLFPQGGFAKAGWAFLLGSLCFQISVLIKSCIGIGVFGMITPFGGLILMLGWIFLLWSGIRAF